VIRTDVFGWFDDTGDTPTHDPGLSGTCPACGATLGRPVRTICLMPVGGSRSYFFRAHRACWDGLDAGEQSAIESSLIDEVAQHPGGVAP
jgi:hypothetical protein